MNGGGYELRKKNKKTLGIFGEPRSHDCANCVRVGRIVVIDLLNQISSVYLNVLIQPRIHECRADIAYRLVNVKRPRAETTLFGWLKLFYALWKTRWEKIEHARQDELTATRHDGSGDITHTAALREPHSYLQPVDRERGRTLQTRKFVLDSWKKKNNSIRRPLTLQYLRANQRNASKNRAVSHKNYLWWY